MGRIRGSGCAALMAQTPSWPKEMVYDFWGKQLDSQIGGLLGSWSAAEPYDGWLEIKVLKEIKKAITLLKLQL